MSRESVFEKRLVDDDFYKNDDFLEHHIPKKMTIFSITFHNFISRGTVQHYQVYVYVM